MDLVLNNLQWLICNKTKPNQTKHFVPGFQIESSFAIFAPINGPKIINMLDHSRK